MSRNFGSSVPFIAGHPPGTEQKEST
jgi:hypothetical protein